MLPDKGIDLSFDTSLYMLNTQAVEAAKRDRCFAGDPVG